MTQKDNNEWHDFSYFNFFSFNLTDVGYFPVNFVLCVFAVVKQYSILDKYQISELFCRLKLYIWQLGFEEHIQII